MAATFIVFLALLQLGASDPDPDPNVIIDVKQKVNLNCGGGGCDDPEDYCDNYPLCWIILPGAGSDPGLVAGICSPFKKPNGWKKRTLCGKPTYGGPNCCSDGCNCYYPTGRDKMCSASGCKVGSVIGVCAPPSEPPTPARYWNNHGTGWGCGDTCECYMPVVSDTCFIKQPICETSNAILASKAINDPVFGICSPSKPNGWREIIDCGGPIGPNGNCCYHLGCNCYTPTDNGCDTFDCKFEGVQGICVPSSSNPPTPTWFWKPRGTGLGCPIGDNCICWTP